MIVTVHSNGGPELRPSIHV